MESSAGKLLNISPLELQFPFELRKQISCSLHLSNKTANYIAFKVKTTNPKKYCVRPNTGIVMPWSTCDVIVTMQAQKEVSPDMQCKDKFLLLSAVVSAGSTPKDITFQTFDRASGNVVEEFRLRVVYVPPPRPPSPIREGLEEGSSPRGSMSDHGNHNSSDFTSVSKAYVDRHDEPQGNLPEVESLLAKVKEEKNNAIQLNKRLQQELELLRRRADQSQGGIGFVYVFIIGLLGIILGYLMKRT